jgi:ADP-heptose:LPS heptosyltransferase
MRIGPGGVLELGAHSNRMTAFTPNKADLNPPKKIARIQELLKSANPKICIIRGEGIGDVIMTLPAIRALKQLFNGRVDITYATNTRYAEGALVKILKGNPDINNVIDRESIDDSEYDSVISLHCPAIQHEKPMAPPINRIDLFAGFLGLTPLQDPIPKIYLSRQEVEEAGTWVYRSGLHGKKFIVVQLFGSSASRSIDGLKVKNALARLYDQHKIQSVIVTHSTDKMTEIQWNEIPGSIVVKDKDCREISAIMVFADLVLCPDSALLHMAGALGVPTVSVFGPTDPRARINYYPNAVAIWEGEKLGGHPHWYERCPYGDLCWKLITEEAIIESCLAQIENTKKLNPDDVVNNVRYTVLKTDTV